MTARTTKFDINSAVVLGMLTMVMSVPGIFFLASETTAQLSLHVNGKIAFTSTRDGTPEIYVMNPDGSDPVRLTNNEIVDDHPAFSPDGKKIAFIRRNYASGEAYINIMNADGTKQTKLTRIGFRSYNYGNGQNEIRSLSWSPDGSRIAFDDNYDVLTIKVNGTDRQNLTNNPDMDIEPAWSPDGSRILFGSSRVGYLTMYTMNAADGSDVRMLPGLGWDVAPDWSATGDRIVLVEAAEEFLPRIVIAKADGTNRRYFDGTGFGDTGERNIPRWSPDSKKIVFHHWVSDDCEIFVKDVSGGESTQLTNTNGWNYQPSWQPIVGPRPDGDMDEQ